MEINELKETFRELLAEEKAKTVTAEQRTTAVLRRNMQKAADNLYVLQYGLQQDVAARKTSMVSMTNYLAFVNEIIDVLKTNDLWPE